MTKTTTEAELLYLVEFNIYTGITNLTVSDTTCTAYIEIPVGGLIVPASKLTSYMKYGGGFKSIKLVGSMYHDEA